MANARKRNKSQEKVKFTEEEIIQGILNYFKPLTDINLNLHESKSPPSLPGGHTLFRHVHITNSGLQHRLATENIPSAGRFTNIDTAHAAITETIAVNFQKVLHWAMKPTANSITLSHELSYDIGVVIERDKPNEIQSTKRVVVSLAKDRTNIYPLEHSIITSHPSLEER